MPTSLDPLPGENEIECARCRAIFFYELTRCPKCGVNLYEPEPEVGEKVFPPHPAGLFAKIGNFFRKLTGKPHPADELFNQSLQQATLFSDLLRKVGGEREMVERLVDFERERFPNGNRTVWLQNAIRRWEQDNQ